jgi:hypothetical protein
MELVHLYLMNECKFYRASWMAKCSRTAETDAESEQQNVMVGA